jgi:hypothetical protein
MSYSTRFSNALGAYSPRLMALAYPGQQSAGPSGPTLQPLPVNSGAGNVAVPSVQQAAQQAAQAADNSVGVGSVDATDATGAAPSTPSPNQSFSGVMGAVNNAFSVATNPMGALASLAVSTYRGQEPTLSMMEALGVFGEPATATMDPNSVTGSNPGATDSLGVGDAMEQGSPGAPGVGTPGGMAGGLAGGQEMGGGVGAAGPGDDPGGLDGSSGADTDPGSDDGSDTSAGTGDSMDGGSGSDGPGDAGSDAGDGGPGDGGSGSDGPGDAGDAGSDGWRMGGPTGDDGDGVLEPIRGTVHEGEFVLRPEAVSYYGPALLAAMNAGQVPRSRLMALLGD